MSIPVGKTFPHYLNLRDAIHMPVIMCKLAYFGDEDIEYTPGQRVEIFKKDDLFFAKLTLNEKSPFIIDPFIDGPFLLSGENVLIYLKPGTIDSVRHVWDLKEIDGKN